MEGKEGSGKARSMEGGEVEEGKGWVEEEGVEETSRGGDEGENKKRGGEEVGRSLPHWTREEQAEDDYDGTDTDEAGDNDAGVLEYCQGLGGL